MPTIHLRAEPGDYAPLVLLPGDPDRATRIAARFDGGLDDARLVADTRRMFGYTGTWHGRPVSVQSTGMGTPSFSIIMEELLRVGVTRLIRVGTTGGIAPQIRVGDVIVATGAAPVDGATRTYLHGEPIAPVADFDLTRALVDGARARLGDRAHVGPVATVDVFYNADADYASRWRARGILGFEMEAAALFTLAGRERGAGRDIRAACMLTVSDVLSESVGSEETFLDPVALADATEAMIEIALEAGTSFEAPASAS
jgi:purine-nucleoside phosphorylase